MSITYSTCFYILKAKFNPNIYIEWMSHFLSIVNHFNLVIYTDNNSVQYINTNNNPRIKIIIKPIEQFYLNKYKEDFIKNHENNYLLNKYVDWRVNMLWCEKLWFVKETIENNYFDTDLHGWCDIGYFRNRQNDTNIQMLSNWSNKESLQKINSEKIYYACVNNNPNEISYLFALIHNKNDNELPITPIPSQQTSIAGGFFILDKNKIEWWSNTFENKMKLYFKHNYLIKDDQIILVDCIFSNMSKFCLVRENKYEYDNWFMFQRYLL